MEPKENPVGEVYRNVFGIQWSCNSYLGIKYVPEDESTGQAWKSIEIRELRFTSPIIGKMMEDGIIEFKVPPTARVVVHKDKKLAIVSLK